MFDENNVPVGQRYDFFMRCCQRLRYGKSECLRLWVERKPQGAVIDGSPPARSQNFRDPGKRGLQLSDAAPES